MADALFTINGDTSDHGFDATSGLLVTLQLKTLPPSGVNTVRFQVFDADDFDADQNPIQNPPAKAKDSVELELDNGTEQGTSIAPLTVDGEVTIQLPVSTYDAWIVRCIVNGGMSTLDDGRVAFDRTLVHERMIVIRDADGFRPVVVTETSQYDAVHGWAPEVKPGAGVPSSDEIPDGSTAGGPTVEDSFDAVVLSIGAVASDVADIEAAIAVPTGDSPGHLARYVFAHASSAMIGETHLGVEVEAEPTWTVAADIPPGRLFHILVYPPAAGGSSGGGNVGTSQISSGGASGGGSRAEGWYSRQDLIDALPIVWSLPLGAAGGVATPNTINITPVIGALPTGSATVGSLLVAHYGGRGGFSSSGSGGGGGGGEETIGGDANTTNAGAGGDPIGGAATAAGNNPSLAGGGSGGGSSKGGNSRTGGGGGGSSRNNAGAALAGGSTQYGSSGGGGAGAPAAAGGETNGAAGGGFLSPTEAGAAGGTGASDDGDDGSPCTMKRGGGGGGGGAGHQDAVVPTVGGDGGDGGFGGGGGGAGGSVAAGSSGLLMTPGDGGKGGDAAGILTAYQ